MYIIIDDKKYQASTGQTILDIARENNIDIPTLCYDPHLTITGACRMCLVETENNGLVTACATPVNDGMKIETNNDKVRSRRREILDLLLSDHDIECMTCEADGDCKLQDLAYEYGLDESSYDSEQDRVFDFYSDNEFIELDPNKCILCGKCIRVDQEVQCSDAIDFIERGFQTKVGTTYDDGFDSEKSTCVFCGQCVEMCPTGALTYIPSKNKGRSKDFREVVTTCPYCGVGCQLNLRIKDNEIIEVGSVYRDGTPNPAGEA